MENNKVEKTKVTVQPKEGHTAEVTPFNLIETAIRSNVSVEQLEKLMAMQERWEAKKSRKEFFAALAKFQSKCPVIEKKGKAAFDSTKAGGGKVKYNYATLDAIIDQIKEPLKENGLTYRWEFAEDAATIVVTCVITHKAGHEEKTTFSAAHDITGAKNAIQSKGSTLTYLQRYTLIGALGIATGEEDIDGAQASDSTTIHPAIQELIDKCDTTDELGLIWDDRVDLQKFKPFIAAMSKRKTQIAEAQKAKQAEAQKREAK